MDAAASTEAGDALREYYAEDWHPGVLWSRPLWDACIARVQPLQLWAEAEAMPDGRGGAVTPAFYLDPAAPTQLWYAPSPSLPAALFVPLPATREAIERAVNELGPRTRPIELAEQRTVRAYMGAVATLQVPSPYSGELEQAGPHELDRHFNFSPAVTPHAWGSAYVDDPLEGGEPLSTVQSIVALREMREQEEDAIPRFTRRAHFSRAHVAMEIHARVRPELPGLQRERRERVVAGRELQHRRLAEGEAAPLFFGTEAAERRDRDRREHVVDLPLALDEGQRAVAGGQAEQQDVAEVADRQPVAAVLVVGVDVAQRHRSVELLETLGQLHRRVDEAHRDLELAAVDVAEQRDCVRDVTERRALDRA